MVVWRSAEPTGSPDARSDGLERNWLDGRALTDCGKRQMSPVGGGGLRWRERKGVSEATCQTCGHLAIMHATTGQRCELCDCAGLHPRRRWLDVRSVSITNGRTHPSMARNSFGIPEHVLSELRSRDKDCVYCRKTLIYPYVAKGSTNCATIEHLNCDGPFLWSNGLQADDLAMCCGSCNSSRGIRTLTDWFRTPDCIEKNINANTVAAPVRSFLERRAMQK